MRFLIVLTFFWIVSCQTDKKKEIAASSPEKKCSLDPEDHVGHFHITCSSKIKTINYEGLSNETGIEIRTEFNGKHVDLDINRFNDYSISGQVFTDEVISLELEDGTIQKVQFKKNVITFLE